MKIRERTKRDNEYATADSEPCGEFYWGVWVKDLFLQAGLGADLEAGGVRRGAADLDRLGISRSIGRGSPHPAVFIHLVTLQFFLDAELAPFCILSTLSTFGIHTSVDDTAQHIPCKTRMIFMTEP